MPAENWREATGQHGNQLNKWGTIAQQKVEAPGEGVGKAARAAERGGGATRVAQQQQQQSNKQVANDLALLNTAISLMLRGQGEMAVA